VYFTDLQSDSDRGDRLREIVELKYLTPKHRLFLRLLNRRSSDLQGKRERERVPHERGVVHTRTVVCQL
jgi:hypothetical protein